MASFRFYQPIDIRYADIDAQRHVNSARYFTFMEQARAKYIQELGLWTDGDFDSLGLILASQKCDYYRPIQYGASLKVGARVTRVGRKSLEMAYELVGEEQPAPYAEGTTVLVAYDYRSETSIPVPDRWRQTIRAFEGDASL